MSRSTYYLSLSGDIKCRYDEKIRTIDNIDPYALLTKELSLRPCELSNSVIMDLVNYLILSNSFYTGAQLKAYKSLKAYKYCESGAVSGISAKQHNDDAFIVLGKVRHSQWFREKPRETWIIILKDGSISSAHCTCMAGLAEVCTHVATVLFFLHARPTTVDDQACTSKLASWPVPPLRNVEMVRVRDRDWARNPKMTALSRQCAPSMDEEEMGELLSKLQGVDMKPAVCRIMEPFASKMSAETQQDLPEGIDSPYKVELVGKPYEEILEIATNTDINITSEQINMIESKTREQSQNNIWFKYRTGRITASRFKSVCRTSIEKPSLSVIKGVCYPQKVTFYSKATAYGVENEKQALKSYEDNASARHTILTGIKSGTALQEEWNFIPQGAFQHLIEDEHRRTECVIRASGENI